jgi:hypothetical protein
VSGDRITASVDLLDGWVRLCYGALAYPGFQAEPARLRVGWSFEAYVPLPAAAQLAFGGKLATTALVEAGRIPARLSFVAQTSVLHVPGAQVH